MADLIPELLDQTLVRWHGETIEMSVKLWNQVHQAAEMDDTTFDEFCTRHLATAAKERLRREAERRRRAAEPRPYGRLRFPSGVR